MIYVKKSLSKSKAKGIDHKLTKTDEERIVGMNDLVISCLYALKKEQDSLKQLLGKKFEHQEMVFTNEFGDYVSPNAVGNRWRRFREKNNFKHVTYHGLRASYASLLSYSGIPLKDISESLGHNNVKTTEEYYTIVYKDAQERIFNVTNKFHK